MDGIFTLVETFSRTPPFPKNHAPKLITTSVAATCEKVGRWARRDESKGLSTYIIDI